MPSLLPQNGQSSRTYSPLTDEATPSFGSIATQTGGSIAYQKRLPSDSSRSDHTASAGSSRTASPIPNASVKSQEAYEEEDIGVLKRDSVKGKGRARVWDPEMGPEDLKDEVGYPPMSEAEEEERRVQENLARFAARDMARRRAARLSRQVPSSPEIVSSSSSTSSSHRLSWITDTKRNSVLGFVDGIMNPTKAGSQELPTMSPRKGLNHIYELPERVASPETEPPFTVPPPESGPGVMPVPKINHPPNGANGASPPQSPTDAQGYSYGYAGPTWRGGAAVQVDDRAEGGEKWWHALCGWGNELDGGAQATDQDDQAGRTNPFE